MCTRFVVEVMPATIKSLLEKQVLQTECRDLSTTELEDLHRDLVALHAERKHAQSSEELKRKGERTLDDMRGLMAKAGISMQEFQDSL